MKRQLLALILAMCLLLPTLVSCAQIEDIIEGIVGGDSKEYEFEDDDYINNGSNIQQGTVGKVEDTEEGKGIAKIEREGNTIIITYKDGSVERIEQEEPPSHPFEDVYEDIYTYDNKPVYLNEGEAIFRFIPTYNGTYQLFSYSNSGDPKMYLYNADGYELASDDDSNGGGNFKLQYDFVAGEVYYISVCAYDMGSVSCYFTIEPKNLSEGTTESFDEIKNPGEYSYTDFYESEKVQVLSSIGAASLRAADYAVVTSVSNGTQLDRIGVSDDAQGYWSKVMYNGEICYVASHLITTIINLDEGFVEVNKTLVKNEGTLSVRIAPEMGAEIIGHVSSGDTVTVVAENTATGWYKISFVPYGETEATFGYISSDSRYYDSETTEAPTTETFETVYKGNSYYVEADYYNPKYFCFVPEYSGTYTIFSNSIWYGNPYAMLYNSDWNYLVSDDNSNGDYNFKIVVDLVAGETYYIEVSSSDYSAASYYLNIDGVYTASVDESIYVSVGANGEMFSFVPENSGVYSIYSFGINYGDPYVSLYDVNYNSLAYNNDGNGGWDFRVDYYLTAGETYYIYATTYDGNSAAYSFIVDLDESVQNVYVGDCKHVCVGGYGAYYAFIPEYDGKYVIYSYNLSYGNPYVGLYDASKNFIVGNDNGVDSDNFRLEYNLKGGEVYFVNVRDCSGYAGADYYFTIEACAEDVEYVYLDEVNSVTVGTEGKTFCFVPQYSGWYRIYSYGTVYGDPYVSLNNSYGGQLAYNDNGNGGYDFYLNYYFSANEAYYINVSANSSSGTSCMFTVTTGY